MKVSEITVDDVKKYLKILDEDDTDVKMILDTAKSFASNYIGLPITGDDSLDTYDDISIAILVLCQDIYDNRSLVSDKSQNINKTVQTILDMHSRNLL